MTIQKKIMISNIAATMITALIICIICVTYVHFHSETLPNRTPADEEVEDILKEMQLVVFAVSSKFIHEKNRAKDTELPLALKNHIPVLPIMLENGLGYEFSNNCAKIQVVPKYGTDPTAIPYDEVLQTFLDSVLVGDQLAEQVRDAFDAYVFLSYRKKDRKHAQRLMRLIHENKQFRDIPRS